jgi:uncharacterized membrane protein YgcG
MTRIIIFEGKLPMKSIFTRITVLLLTTLLVLPLGSAIAEDEKKKTYSQQELDQMMAPVALYPDSLLSQILMASTYPGDVAEAVEWSKKNTKKTGDDAVKAVQKKSWDPSVMSLVAFPSVLDMMGQKPDWVQAMGDAFLADSEGVMDTVQSLRKKAKDEGNLETTKEQTVKTDDSTTPQVIIIEPSDPEVIYVPTYNPTIIYGTWWWPSYYPYYYRPVGYGFGTGIVTGIGFGIGIGITNSLWGGFNWRRHDVDINVNRHNNINVNSNRINSSSRNTTWKHNSSNVNSVNRTNNFNKTTNNTQVNRQKASDKISGSDKRDDFRGRDADREKAKATLESRGVDPAKGRQELKGSGGSKARDTVSKTNHSFDSSKVSKNLGSAKPSNMDTGKISNMDASRKSDFSSKKSSFNDHAFSDVGNARSSHSNISRGTSSNRSFQSSGGMSRGGGGMSRGGGGGGRRR